MLSVKHSFKAIAEAKYGRLSQEVLERGYNEYMDHVEDYPEDHDTMEQWMNNQEAESQQAMAEMENGW